MEILNIEYHTHKLLIKALNKCRTKQEAADQLGVSVRTVHRLINDYQIEWSDREKIYLSNKKISYNIIAAQD